MIIKLKYKDKECVFGTWLYLDQVDEAVYNALNHNRNNFTYSYFEEGISNIFNNIVDEFKFLKEFDIGHTIHEDDIDVVYDLLYHNDFGLMAEGNSKFQSHPKRIILEE